METIERIALLLKDKNIEQKSLMDYLGISAQVFTDWKGKRNNSYLKHLNKIADYLNVSTDYLLGKDNIKKRATPEQVERIQAAMAESDEIKEYVERYLSLSPEDQKKMNDLIDLLIRANEHK